MWSADAGEDFKQDITASGELFHPEMQRWIDDMDSKPKPTVFETWQNQHRRTLLATAWHERWETTKNVTGTGRPIDGLIMPSTPFPAIKHGGGYPVSWIVMMYNSEKLTDAASLGRSVATLGSYHWGVPGH
jgi:amidase